MASGGKRQPRKLTKRGPSETALDKPKAVLQKKSSRSQGGNLMDNGDGQGVEVIPSAGG